MAENKNLLILGAGQHGQVVKEIAEAMQCFSKILFLDDQQGALIGGEIIGKLDCYAQKASEYCFAYPAFGNPGLRQEWMGKLKEAGYVLPVIVHPAAVVSPSAQLCEAVAVGSMAVVNTHSVIGSGCIISAGAVVDHDCFLGECVHVDAGAVVACNSRVMANRKIEAGNVYRGQVNSGIAAAWNDHAGADCKTGCGEKKVDVALNNLDADWVKDHVKQFGTEPGFF